MKKFLPNKEEKTVLIVGVLVLSLILGLGLYKTIFGKSDNKIVKRDEVTLKLKNSTFTLEAGEAINEEVSFYVDEKESVLKNVKLDLSKVDVKKIGTYDAFVTYKKEKFPFKVEVKDTKAPVLSAEYNQFDFYIEANSRVDEIKEFARVSAKDALDGDLTSKIEGWPTELPTTAGEQIYTVKVKDATGNEATMEIKVTFYINNNGNVSNPSTNNPVTPPVNNGGNTEQNSGTGNEGNGAPETPETPPTEE